MTDSEDANDPWRDMPYFEENSRSIEETYSELRFMNREEILQWIRDTVRSGDETFPKLDRNAIVPIFYRHILEQVSPKLIIRNAQLSGEHYSAFESAFNKALREGLETHQELEGFKLGVEAGARTRPKNRSGRPRPILRDYRICEVISAISAIRKEYSVSRNDETDDHNSILDLVAEALGMLTYDAVKKIWQKRDARWRG